MDYASILETFEKFQIELDYAIADLKNLRNELGDVVDDLQHEKSCNHLPVNVGDCARLVNVARGPTRDGDSQATDQASDGIAPDQCGASRGPEHGGTPL